MQIAVIGSNMIDLVSYVDRMPELGETLAGNDFAMGHGGKGANQAVAASRLGSSVRMLTRVGDDTFANDTIANFEREGIDTRWVLRTEGPSGVAPIFVDAQSRNSIVIVPGANMSLTAADITDATDDLAECQLIVLQLEVPLETVYAAIEFGTAHDIPVLLNPAPAHPDLDLAKITGATFFVPNETELALLTDKPVESLDQVREAAQGLREAGITNVIVTLGERGALWLAEGVDELVEGQAVQAVDSTGAGDAFIGCFAHEFVQHGDVAKAIAAANRYAADSVTRRGTQTSYATAEEFGSR